MRSFGTNKTVSSSFFMHGATDGEVWAFINDLKPKGNMHVLIPGYSCRQSITFTQMYTSQDFEHSETTRDQFHQFK